MSSMAKPDNREDNVAKLQSNINHTIRNLEEAEDYLSEHADEIGATEREQILEKNARRRESLEGFRSEIRDEALNQRNS
jgi:small acid-soluble spore protein (thioredoxin-like protein)